MYCFSWKCEVNTSDLDAQRKHHLPFVMLEKLKFPKEEIIVEKVDYEEEEDDDEEFLPFECKIDTQKQVHVPFLVSKLDPETIDSNTDVNQNISPRRVHMPTIDTLKKWESEKLYTNKSEGDVYLPKKWEKLEAVENPIEELGSCGITEKYEVLESKYESLDEQPAVIQYGPQRNAHSTPDLLVAEPPLDNTLDLFLCNCGQTFKGEPDFNNHASHNFDKNLIELDELERENFECMYCKDTEDQTEFLQHIEEIHLMSNLYRGRRGKRRKGSFLKKSRFVCWYLFCDIISPTESDYVTHIESHANTPQTESDDSASQTQAQISDSRDTVSQTESHDSASQTRAQISDSRDTVSQTESQICESQTHNDDFEDAIQFQCPICGKSFRLGSLNRHMQIHIEERPYECTICDKRFKQLGHLRNHVLSHTTEKSYECSICKLGFCSKLKLKRHFVTHTFEGKPLECDICHKVCKQKVQLMRHKCNLSKMNHSV